MLLVLVVWGGVSNCWFGRYSSAVSVKSSVQNNVVSGGGFKVDGVVEMEMMKDEK